MNNFSGEIKPPSKSQITTAVLEAHKIGSFRECGNVCVDTATLEIFVLECLSSSLIWVENSVIYSYDNKDWDADLNLSYVIHEDMHIIASKFLNDVSAGREATESEKQYFQDKANIRSLTEFEFYDNMDWAVILKKEINVVVSRYLVLVGIADKPWLLPVYNRHFGVTKK